MDHLCHINLDWRFSSCDWRGRSEIEFQNSWVLILIYLLQINIFTKTYRHIKNHNAISKKFYYENGKNNNFQMEIYVIEENVIR